MMKKKTFCSRQDKRTAEVHSTSLLILPLFLILMDREQRILFVLQSFGNPCYFSAMLEKNAHPFV